MLGGLATGEPSSCHEPMASIGTASSFICSVRSVEVSSHRYSWLGTKKPPESASKVQARETAMEYLNTYGLAGFENAYPRMLSGGMRQRVALIRTLINDPDIILLDEPFSALDYQTRLYLEGVLMEAVETFHKTVVLVTHDIDEAVALSKRVVVLGGRPSQVKKIYDIDIAARSPIGARSDPNFSGYFHALCGELDIQTEVGSA